MKRSFYIFLVVSLLGNICLTIGCLWLVGEKKTMEEDAVIAEMLWIAGVRDISYFLRHSEMTKEKIFKLSQNQPAEKGEERIEPELNGNRFYRPPVEIVFSKSGRIETIKLIDYEF